MERIRVLQGCSICEGGLWYSQGAVLEVADASKHVRTVTDGEGKVSVLPCTEPAPAAELNQPKGITPKTHSQAPAKSKEK